MQISVINFILFSKFPPLLSFSRNGRKLKPTIWARRPDVGENNSPTKPPFTLKIPKSFLAKSAVALFGLGFIDAGYSGDWSRIGVISKETEDLLKIVAYLIGPLCLLLIFSISEEERAT